MTKVAPSLLAADYLHLADEIQRMADAGADILHYDVMDGMFVPNISFGPDMAKFAAKGALPLDVHLMIEKPHRYLEAFAKAKPAYITIHLEATEDAARDLKTIRDMGIRAGLAISPDTPVEAVKPYLGMIDLLLIMSVYPGFGGQKYIENSTDKLREAAALKREGGYTFELEVDGGINEQTGITAAQAGATMLVAGSAMFKAADASAFCRTLQQA